jgi:hypothetical protein
LRGQLRPFCSVNYGQVYPYFAAGVWAAVMWLYEAHPKLLQPSLETSMRCCAETPPRGAGAGAGAGGRGGISRGRP